MDLFAGCGGMTRGFVDTGRFTPVFAVGRAAGWLAHAMEQRQAGRLIRPSSSYVGPRPEAAPAGA